jgi:selenocysteine-specific elongation factor
MAHYIIGTAGHVDHGKSALVKTLTGVDPDRLPEERSRGLTIDLGFAPLTLPSGMECSMVDVPGHERYLKNMLAGAGGFDFALLVVDAGEGIKEQTIEHLEIMHLLGVKDGITVITKVDRVEPSQVDAVELELTKFLKNTFLHASPIIRVSTVTGEGIESLLYSIESRIVRLTPRKTDAPFRMPIDRVFIKMGVGPVVTGTIYQGKVEENDRVMFLPEGKVKKIRAIQIFDRKNSKAEAGQRAAFNIPGVEPDAVFRGDLLVTPGSGRATGRMDAMVEILKSSPQPLKNRSEVRFHAGAMERFAKVVLLDRNELKPGEKGPAQFVFKESAVVFAGDRFIIRAPSSIHTFGGGVVLEPYPQKHRRFDQQDLEMLRLKENADPLVLLREMMNKPPYILHTLETILNMVSLQPYEVNELIMKLEADGELYRFQSGRFVHQKVLAEIKNAVEQTLIRFETEDPTKLGTKPEELRLNLPKSEDKLIREVVGLMKIQKIIRETNYLLSTYDFKASLDGEKAKCHDILVGLYEEAPFTPPTIDDLIKTVRFPEKVIKDVLSYMVHTGELIAIDDKINFLQKYLEKARRIIGHHIVKNGEITASDARQLLETTRKYIIPLLEYFDRTHFTKRKENVRVLFRSNVILMEEEE